MATKHGRVSYKILDNLGVTVSMPIYVAVDDTKTVAQALTDANLIGQQIDPIIDGQILQTSMAIDGGPPSGAKSSPVSTAEVERTGLFNFDQATSPYRFGVDVPSIADAKIVNGKIDLTDADIIAFLDVLTAAGTALTPESTSLYTLVALLDALLTFRKHRKAESRRSLVSA
jgi:hypothetical protein